MHVVKRKIFCLVLIGRVGTLGPHPSDELRELVGSTRVYAEKYPKKPKHDKDYRFFNRHRHEELRVFEWAEHCYGRMLQAVARGMISLDPNVEVHLDMFGFPKDEKHTSASMFSDLKMVRPSHALNMVLSSDGEHTDLPSGPVSYTHLRAHET